MVIVVVTLCAGTADELAVMVTVPPGGAETGAMKVAATPLAVWRLMEPQSAAVELAQVSSQLTPRLLGSLFTMAANCAVEFAATEDGGAICPGANVMVVGAGLTGLHPVNSRIESPHKISRNPSLEYVVRGCRTDLRFILIVSTIACVECVVENSGRYSSLAMARGKQSFNRRVRKEHPRRTRRRALRINGTLADFPLGDQ
jgi:hypothetical protein